MREAQINLYNTDCMEGMKEFPDNYFHLAIVDPPYGIGMSKGAGETRGENRNKKKDLYIPKDWDSSRPDKAYFDELRRVSKNQIIWGGNYFADLLPASRGWIYWRKLMGGNYSHGELAYTSFDKILLEFTKRSESGGRIHPTQKPESLYIWLLQNYTKSNNERILDTHLGSGSIAIAADKLGFDLWGYELDKDYYEGAVNRLSEHRKQLRLF